MSPATMSEPTNGASIHVNEATKIAPENSTTNIASFRHLVPLVKDVTYLNVSLAPPSNLIVHEAITKFASEALYNPPSKAAMGNHRRRGP